MFEKQRRPENRRSTSPSACFNRMCELLGFEIERITQAKTLGEPVSIDQVGQVDGVLPPQVFGHRIEPAGVDFPHPSLSNGIWVFAHAVLQELNLVSDT